MFDGLMNYVTGKIYFRYRIIQTNVAVWNTLNIDDDEQGGVIVIDQEIFKKPRLIPSTTQPSLIKTYVLT